jgi:hypothetical protein
MHPITVRFPRTDESFETWGPADAHTLIHNKSEEEPVEIHCTAAQALELLCSVQVPRTL